MADSVFGPAGILGCDETEMRLDSWADFVREFALNASPNWIFRGHASAEWSLVTSLQRACERAGIAEEEKRAAVENSTIGFFQDRARLHLDRPPDDHNLLGWLAVMQHYGAPTRLQDWTQSPFVAAYFAYREETGVEACLWSLQALFCRRMLTPVMIGQAWDHLGVLEMLGKDAEGNDVAMFPWTQLTRIGVENETLREAIRGGNGWPLPVLPLSYDSRMAAQQAVFVCATRTDFKLEALLDAQNWPKANAPDHFADHIAAQQNQYPLEHPHQLIKRVRLPAAWRPDALRTLRQMGIAEETLFPGLDGAGRAAGMHLVSGDFPLQDALHSLGI